VNEGNVTPVAVSNQHDHVVEVPLADRVSKDKIPEINYNFELRQGSFKASFV